VPVSGEDRWTFRLHTCRLDEEKSRKPWKYVQTQPPEVATRGARRARAVLASNKKRKRNEGNE